MICHTNLNLVVTHQDVQSGVLGGGSRASHNALCSESDSKLDKNHLMDFYVLILLNYILYMKNDIFFHFVSFFSFLSVENDKNNRND